MPSIAFPGSLQDLAAARLRRFRDWSHAERFRVGRPTWPAARHQEWQDLGGRRTRAAARELALSYACLYSQPIYLVDLLALPIPIVAVVRPIAPVRAGRAA